ncbi:MAG: hypothetical protein NVSMB38_21080 [Ktedonobacteraceae bacterium]
MITEERLPPACAFAVSVLAERDTDPDAVPEEAVEAAQLHMATCTRCLNAQAGTSTARKKKKTRRGGLGTEYTGPLVLDAPVEDATSLTSEETTQEMRSPAQVDPHATRSSSMSRTSSVPETPQEHADLVSPSAALALLNGATLNCQQCRSNLKEYAEAMDNGQNVADLYPEVQEHLLTCESGCLVLLDIFRQDAKLTRKYRRRLVRNPLSVIGWEATGFFRGGQLPVSPMALSYGTLLLLLLVASLSAFLGISWDNARYYHPTGIVLPTPDGIGVSDGLRAYDACNANSYYNKREAAQAMQDGDFSKAHSLLASAISTTVTDTTGCNGAEAAIYLEDLHVRQSGHPYGMIVVSFDSGPGNADPQGGTDRHVLYAAHTQELVGAFIGQQQYNTAQMKIAGAPLLYLVLANTTGVERGALQIAEVAASLANGSTTPQQLGLLATVPVGATHPVLGVLGLGPSTLVRAALPIMCRAGLPLIVPTATGLFVLDIITSTALYRHCTPGFAFVRFSPDDQLQSSIGAEFAYNHLHVHNAAIFYDPSDPSSEGSAHSFGSNFQKYNQAHIVAQETTVSSGILDTHGRPQAAQDVLLAGLKDALNVQPRPELLYTSLLTSDVVTLAKAIARLPQNQQPILMVGGEYIVPSALQGLVQWTRQQQLALPRIFVSFSSAVRPPTESWPKQFYASFCTSFAAPGNYCSGAAALDQGALFFGDGIEIVAKAIGPIDNASKFPTSAEMVQRISQEDFAGVSCPIALHIQNLVVVVGTKVLPVVVGIQEDGSFQVVG